MDKEDQIIKQLEVIERESKVIRSLLTVLLGLVSLLAMVNFISD